MSIGIWQLVIVLFLALLFFGTGRLPSLMKDVALGIRSFKKGLHEGTEDDNDSTIVKLKSPKKKRKS